MDRSMAERYILLECNGVSFGIRCHFLNRLIVSTLCGWNGYDSVAIHLLKDGSVLFEDRDGDMFALPYEEVEKYYDYLFSLRNEWRDDDEWYSEPSFSRDKSCWKKNQHSHMGRKSFVRV